MLFVVLCTPGGAAQSSGGGGPAEKRARELVQVLNTGDRAAARSYAETNYAPQFLASAPMEAHLGFVSQFHDRTRGLEVHGVQDSSANEITLLLKGKLTGGWEALVVRVEPEPPNRITGIGRRPPRPPATDSQQKLSDTDVVSHLDAYLQKLADADVFSGAVVVARDGRTIYKKAFGTANKDFNAPNKIDTKFNLGSMNKMFTAVAIAQLVERGKISFEDPLSKFLPDFPTKEDAVKIKIKHLLTHTSGLGSYFNRKFMEASRARFRTVNDFIELIREEKLAFEPGARWQYSNTGFLALGIVIEKATGQSYYDYIRENIARPAGMLNTDAYELDRVNPNLAVGYQKEFTDSGVNFRNNIFQHVIRGGPAGGGYSTAEDLLRFDIALRGHKLVGPDYVKLLLSPKPEMNSPDYGYGFQVETDRGIAGHGGGFPGISSNLSMFLDLGYTSVVLSNYGGASQPVIEKITELILAGRRRAHK
jgi:CubicO group peptidase (beta-lactamase class C family)